MADDHDVLSRFERSERGFLERKGRAFSDANRPCNKKLCMTSVSVAALAEILCLLSERDDCWFVKLDPAPQANGMVRGRCFLMSEAAVGEVWQKYKNTDVVLCTVQDDDFTRRFRASTER